MKLMSHYQKQQNMDINIFINENLTILKNYLNRGGNPLQKIIQFRSRRGNTMKPFRC